MALVVLKFGGTSVGSIDRIKNVALRVKKFFCEGHQVLVVVSAMSGETNRLLGLIDELSNNRHGREQDAVVSTGEQVTIGLLAIALNNIGCRAKSFTGWQAGILTDEVHSKARIEQINAESLKSEVEAGVIPIIAGFQGLTEANAISTLGRGGSDTTAVAVAAALKADECQIFTDVDGVYTTDPRVVKSAQRMEKITFEEMLEMASLGSKVLQIRAVEFAGKYKVPLRIRSTFDEGEGTLITLDEEEVHLEKPIISGIAFNRDEAKLIVRGVPDVPGAAYSILGPISEANIEVDMIVQNVADDNSTDFTFTVHRNDYVKAKEILAERLCKLEQGSLSGTDDICKISLVGVGMRSHAGIAAKMFSVLAEEKINIQMISTSEIKISVVINEKYLELAVRALHTAFELDDKGAA